MGGTTIEEQFADVTAMLARDEYMAARVAAVYRRFDAVEMSRNPTEDLYEFARRSAAAFTEKRPSKNNPHAASCDEDPTQTFYVVDLGQIVMQMAKWRKNLPGVHVHYAVKCNNSDALCAMIAALGGSFDCASLAEIKQVLEPGYARTPSYSKMTEWTGDHAGPLRPIIFAQPAKLVWQMQQAEKLGITRTTFDNQDELIKIQAHMPSAEAVIRIATDDSSAVCRFSTKFGCPADEARDLISFAKEIGVNVVGVAFHVGSGNNDPRAYHQALRDARMLFDHGKSLGFDMRLLDLGGGWSGADPEPKADGSRDLSFEELTAAIRPVLYDLFPLETTEIIAEPGRFFGASSSVLCTNVHAMRRTVEISATGERTALTNLHIGEGCYSGFNCLIFDHALPRFRALDAAADASNERRLTTIWGPTCDSMDKTANKIMFPPVKCGDWIFVPEFGAYTMAASSAFNGYQTRRFEYISSLPSGVVPYLAE
jgi:ornithine decarboxylase